MCDIRCFSTGVNKDISAVMKRSETMVPRRRIELRTRGFSGLCSTN